MLKRLLPSVYLALAFCLCGGMSVALGSSQAGGTVSGRVIDAATGLGLSGVQVTTEGVMTLTTVSDRNGAFKLSGLTTGTYELIVARSGYETTASEQFQLGPSSIANITLAVNRTQGGDTGVRVLGRTTIRASQSLQTASVVYRSVSSQSLQQQGYFRAADYLNELPGLPGANFSQPGDDVSLSIRGIGTLETLALIDGHPIGPRGNYNYELSPVFGLRDIDVLYGSGSDFYGVNAIGGVIDMQTLEPTLQPSLNLLQSYGTFNKLSSAVQATGSLSGGKLGYALASGTQGLDGPFHRDRFYQASAAWDPYATDPAVRALGVYQDDTSFVNKSGLIKLRYHFNDTSQLTATILSSSEWDDKTGNGDNDYIPYEVALATGQANLAAAAASGGDGCTLINPKTFTAPTPGSGAIVGFGPNGKPDGGNPCQSAQSYALANYGYQGAGPAWQSYKSNDFHVRYETTVGKKQFVADGFSNYYFHTYDRTAQLPYAAIFDQNGNLSGAQPTPFWYNNGDSNTGFTLSENVLGDVNEFGYGFYYANTASRYLTRGKLNLSPVTDDTALYVRDAFHPKNSHLTTYFNAWLKDSTITNTSYLEPRVAFVYTAKDTVYRLAAGRTSAQPTPDQLQAPFVPTAVGAFSGGGVSCSSLNSVGTTPSSSLRPERATDAELSVSHRFNEDSTIQASLYNTNLFNQIQSTTAPLSVLGIPFDPTPYALIVQGLCPGLSAAQAVALLGVSGNVNIGHVLARGLEIVGRQRVAPKFYVDYTYDTQSSVLKSEDPELVNPAFGGNLTLIPNSQQPNVPLHKYSYALDYTFNRGLEARLTTYHISQNNPNNLPAYGFSNFSLLVPSGRTNVTVSVNNVFRSHADFRNMVGLGQPLPLNQYAQPSDYARYFGASATERFNLPFRTIQVTYSAKIR